MKKKTKIIPYDDYNSKPNIDGVVGAIRQTCGNLAFRNGYKIIEIYKKDDYEDTDVEKKEK